MAKHVFGIDLGTTYSCIAYLDEDGRPTIINNSEGTPTTPSVVDFESETNVSVGQAAKENLLLEPERTVDFAKRLMGNTDVARNIRGVDISPEEVSSYILKKLANDAAANLNTEVKDVVITCPAYFGAAHCKATKDAGIIAGLNVLELLQEPVAAALYYAYKNRNKEESNQKTVMVYDLGGGTFDVTVIDITPEKVQVICSDGNHQLGGKNWDEALIVHVGDQFRAMNEGLNQEYDEYMMQSLRTKCENAKQYLSSREETPIVLDYAGYHSKISVTREIFDTLTSPLLDQTIELTRSVLENAKEKGYEVSEILLVGGSTKMLQVEKALAENFDIPLQQFDPDEAVAKGAAIYAAMLYTERHDSFIDVWKRDSSGSDDDGGGQKIITDSGTTINPEDYKESIDAKITIGGGKGPAVVFATTKSYAVEVVIDNKNVCQNLIYKNQQMPEGRITSSQTYGTYQANMSQVDIVVYENDFEEELFEVNPEFVLDTAVLLLPGNLPAGAPIEVTFTLNNEGLLFVTGRDVTNDKKIEVKMHIKGTLTDEQVNEAMERSRNITVL